MKVRLKTPLTFAEGTKLKGEVADLPTACALEHIAAGRVEPIEEVKQEELKPEATVLPQPEEVPAVKTVTFNKKGKR